MRRWYAALGWCLVFLGGLLAFLASYTWLTFLLLAVGVTLIVGAGNVYE